MKKLVISAFSVLLSASFAFADTKCDISKAKRDVGASCANVAQEIINHGYKPNCNKVAKFQIQRYRKILGEISSASLKKFDEFLIKDFYDVCELSCELSVREGAGHTIKVLNSIHNKTCPDG